MNDMAVWGLIAIGALAVLGLGIKIMVSIKVKSGNKTVIKNVTAGGDVVGRDKKIKNE